MELRESKAKVKGKVKDLVARFRIIFKLLGPRPRMKSATVDYSDYWKERRLGSVSGKLNFFQRKRAEWVAARIRPGASVLDLGCGDGAILKYLQKKKNIEPLGADFYALALQSLSKEGVKTFQIDLEKDDLGLLPEVNHLLLFEVLEHLKDPESLLLKIMEKAHHSVFVSVPNTGYFPYRLRLLFGSFPMQWRVHPGEHIRFWTYTDFKWWLGQLDLAEKSFTDVYQGLPILNKLVKNVFGMGIIAEIRK